MWHNLTKFNLLTLKKNFTDSQYKKQTTVVIFCKCHKIPVMCDSHSLIITSYQALLPTIYQVSIHNDSRTV